MGLVLTPDAKVEQLAPDLARFALIALEFSGPGEGRGYSQARLLRERLGFGGELRAVGYVRRDQLFFMARCGFNSFELAEQDFRCGDGRFFYLHSRLSASQRSRAALQAAAGYTCQRLKRTPTFWPAA